MIQRDRFAVALEHLASPIRPVPPLWMIKSFARDERRMRPSWSLADCVRGGYVRADEICNGTFGGVLFPPDVVREGEKP